MRTPIVTEIARPLEWVTPDTFIEDPGGESTPAGRAAGTRLSDGRKASRHSPPPRRTGLRELSATRSR